MRKIIALSILCLSLGSSFYSEPSSQIMTANSPEYSLADINTGFIISKALAEAYPDIIQGPVWEDDDWVITLREQKFYWAGGRLLNAEARSEPDYEEKYGTYSFHDYPEELPADPSRASWHRPPYSSPVWRGLQRVRKSHNPEFQRLLYNTWKRQDMDNINVREIRFLGFKTKVHVMIIPSLRRIETKLQELRKSDKELDTFLKGIRSISAYLWRNIAGTNRLSLHSYGIAVDFIPYRWKGDPYWYWVRNRGEDWTAYPYDKRWQVPEVVIKAFEEEGYIWGGKWYQFDNMHFEYHPEINKLKPYFDSLRG